MSLDGKGSPERQMPAFGNGILSLVLQGKKELRIAVPWRGLSLSVLSAALLMLAFPPFDLSLLAWIALVPLLLALKNEGKGVSFTLTFLSGMLFMMGIFYWINVVEGVKLRDFLILGIYFGCYFGCFGLSLALVSQRTLLNPALVAPSLWVSLEYLRSNADFLALPWALLGHSQYTNTTVIQIASFVGVYGISFLIVIVNATLYESSLFFAGQKSKGGLVAAISATTILLGLVVAYGQLIPPQGTKGQTIRVTAIQGNISQDIKWDRRYLQANLQKHVILTREAARNSTAAALVVWPESSAQGLLPQDISLLKTVRTLAQDTNSHLLVGSAARPKFGPRGFRKSHWFNSAFLISPSGMLAQYHKIYLLPFAEYLPHQETISWSKRLASAAGHFIPGKERTLFSVDGVLFGVTICWENIFPDHFRKFVLNGARFMVNITNEAWFGETAAPYHFLAMSVFRAVENRVSLIRAANTGVSAVIDPYGRVAAKVSDGNKDMFIAGYLTKEILLSEEKTFYTRYGDIFAEVVLGATVLLLIYCFFKRTHPNTVNERLS